MPNNETDNKDDEYYFQDFYIGSGTFFAIKEQTTSSLNNAKSNLKTKNQPQTPLQELPSDENELLSSWFI